MDPDFLAFLTGVGISEARYKAGSLSLKVALIREFNESKRGKCHPRHPWFECLNA
jgi:hypothetical protein